MKPGLENSWKPARSISSGRVWGQREQEEFMKAISEVKLRQRRKVSVARSILVLVMVFAASACLAQVKPTTMQVDVNNFVLYNYDTFDTTQFGMNPAATNVMMKTYNYHVSIGDIVAVNGTPAKGTLLCTHTMFVLSPTATVGSMKAIADTKRSMIDDCSLEVLTSDGTAVGTIFIHGLFGGAPAPGAPATIARSDMIVTGGTGAFLGARGQAGQTGPWTPRVASVTEDPANRRINGGGAESIVLQLFPIFPPGATQ
jgi:hypothetical protein